MVRRTVTVLGDGLMGRAIEARAREKGFDVAGVFGRRALENEGDTVQRALEGSDVAVEVSIPEAAVANALRCLDVGCPVVVGTTGWYDDLPDVEAAVARTGGALLWAANFSLGVALMRSLCGRAGAWLSTAPDFDVAMLETHHARKKDAPSGTAIVLAQATEATAGRDVPIESQRVGHVPGTHELIIDGPFEHLVIRHEARDRRVFADGALYAASWLIGRQGLWTIDDVFGDAPREENAQ